MNINPKRITLQFTILFLSISGISFGQVTTDYIEVLQSLKKELLEVPGKSRTYKQSLSWEAERPYLIQLDQEEVDKNGKSKKEVYKFSLLDVDQNTILAKSEKDIIKVPIYIKSKKKFIKYFVDGKQGSYLDRIAIVGLNIENGRNIEGLLKQASKMALELKVAEIPKNYDGGIAWLTKNISAVDVNDAVFKQGFELDKDINTVFEYSRTEVNNKNETESWSLDLADLQFESLELNTKGNLAFVVMELKKNRYSSKESSNQKKFVDDLTILAEEIVDGQTLLAVLQLVAKEAEELEKERFKKTPGLKTPMMDLASKVNSMKFSGGNIVHNLNDDCISKYTVSESDSKGKTKNNTYQVNLADLNPQSIDLKVSGSQLALNLQTSSEKLIQVFEEDEVQNYSNRMQLIASGMENVKWLQLLIPKAISTCKTNLEQSMTEYENADFSVVEDLVVSVNGIDQTLSIVDEDVCTWKLTQSEESRNGITMEAYEFGLTDISSNDLKLSISGKNLGVPIKVKGNEKIIKYYKDGEPGVYQNKVVLRMDNIENTRLLVELIKRKIKACEK